MFIFSILFWPILIIIVVIALLRRRGSNHLQTPKIDPAVYLSETLILMSVGFLGLALYNSSKNLGIPIDGDYILLLIVLLSFWASYAFRLNSTMLFSIVGFAVWWIYRATLWTKGIEIKEAAVLSVIVLYTISLYQASFIFIESKRYQNYSYILKSIGIVPILFILFVFSTASGLSMIRDNMVGVNGIFASPAIALSFGIIFITTVLMLAKNLSDKKLITSEIIIAVVPLIIFTFLALTPSVNLFTGTYYYSSSLNSVGYMYAAVFNVATFLVILALIMGGYKRSDRQMINLGVFAMFIFILVKYFDWFFSFLDKSLFFLGAGILLFGLGWFMENGRKKVLEDIKTHE